MLHILPVPWIVMYHLNLNRHVKIWLSTNDEVFMNVKNQVRLRKLRFDNPNDEITLIYDSRLLLPQALNDLYKFCKKHQIAYKDAAEIKAANELEQRLLYFYEEEIFAIANYDKAGNPAAASDILRWIKEVYSLGVYSDFDVKIKAISLDELIVDEPIIIKKELCGEEVIIFNNNFVAIVEGENTAEKVAEVQKYMLALLDNTKIAYGKMLNKLEKSIPLQKVYHFLVENFVPCILEDCTTIVTLRRQLNNNFSVVFHKITTQQEIRDQLIKIIDSFLDTLPLQGLQEAQHRMQEPFTYLLLQRKQNLSDDLKILMHIVYYLCADLYRYSVMCTTGPSMLRDSNYPFNTVIFNSLCEKFSLNSDESDLSWLPKDRTNLLAAEERKIKGKTGKCVLYLYLSDNAFFKNKFNVPEVRKNAEESKEQGQLSVEEFNDIISTCRKVVAYDLTDQEGNYHPSQ